MNAKEILLTQLRQIKSIFIRDNPRLTIAAFSTLIYLFFQIYRTFINPLPPLLLRPINVAVCALLCFFYHPIKLKEGVSRLKKTIVFIIDAFGFLAAPFLVFYHISNFQRLAFRINYFDPVYTLDRIVCVILVVFVIIGIWRTVGKALPIILILFLVYGFVSPWLPGILYYRGFTFDRLTSLLVLGNEGMYGTGSGAAAGFLFWMMLFGELFSGGSGGSVLIDIGMKAGSRTKDSSAPAKTAVLSSCLFGMISGSAVANVTATGTFTIPMMKKAGYTPEEAGAIESASSTGGQIMPPMMGASAFLMAEILGINYITIATAAFVPGFIYYAGVFLVVHLLAKRRSKSAGYVPVQFEASEKILPRLFMLLPIPVMITTMAIGYTIQRASLYAILSVIILNYISSKKHRRTTSQLFEMLIGATRKAAIIGMPLSGVGIIIGIITMSGLASRLSAIILSFGAQYQWVGLIITMIGCMILGMALPTSASYLTGYVLFLPTLRAIGIPMLPANLFIFYFGIFSHVTPPVCITAFTAAGIAGGNVWKTGWKAFSYAMVGFLVPYVFIYQSGVLLMGPLTDIILHISIVVAGTALLGVGVAGYLFKPLSLPERFLFGIAGIMVCIPETVTDIIGFALGGILLTWQIILRVRAKNRQTVAAG